MCVRDELVIDILGGNKLNMFEMGWLSFACEFKDKIYLKVL
jgi:hypothetical protein